MAKANGELRLKPNPLTLLFVSLWLYLQFSRASSSSSSLQVNQGFQGSAAARGLKEVEGNIHEHEVHCSRERSRAASKIIEEYLTPFIERERYQLPNKCRLHPDYNLYRDQEQHKIHVDINEWRCGYCRKSFYEEKFLDQHFDNRHYDLLNVSRGKCLADLCGALHCDLMMDSVQKKTKCNPAAAVRNKHSCEGLADSCFPVKEGPPVSRLHEFFLRQFCDAHTCSGRHKPFSKGRRKRRSIFFISMSLLVLLVLPLFYLFVYYFQRGMRRGTQDLRRITENTRKKKPS